MDFNISQVIRACFCSTTDIIERKTDAQNIRNVSDAFHSLYGHSTDSSASIVIYLFITYLFIASASTKRRRLRSASAERVLFAPTIWRGNNNIISRSFLLANRNYA